VDSGYSEDQLEVMRKHKAQLEREVFVHMFFGSFPPDEPEPSQKPMGIIEFIEKANTTKARPITVEEFDKAMEKPYPRWFWG
jgi:hypothetical protein